jgi:uncharacterized protein with FMN-binding domain
MKTKAAASLLEERSDARLPPMPAPAMAGETRTPERIEPPVKGASIASLSVVPTMPPSVPKSVSPAASATRSSAVVSPKQADEAEAATVTRKNSSTASTVDAAVPTATVASHDAEPAGFATTETKTPKVVMPKEFYIDGSYLGWGTSRHGDIQASVTISNGRIVAAAIAQCWTRYSCSWIEHLPEQVLARQSADVDFVSGATQSVNAFYYAVLDALAKAK